jgi:hypothetical protein
MELCLILDWFTLSSAQISIYHRDLGPYTSLLGQSGWVQGAGPTVTQTDTRRNTESFSVLEEISYRKGPLSC